MQTLEYSIPLEEDEDILYDEDTCIWQCCTNYYAHFLGFNISGRFQN